jgi:hypothetical protein
VSYDYVLFDNRTLGPSGHTDFGAKAEVGSLKGHMEAISKMESYSRAPIKGGISPVLGFGAALGGVRLSNGYLLCASIEVKDNSGRPSYAVVGIYCPSVAGLETLLTSGNPIQMARSVYAGSRPPASLAPAGSPLADGVSSRAVLARGLHRLTDSSPKEAAVLLLKGALAGQLPSIRGLALFDGDSESSLGGFDHAFCRDLPREHEAAYLPSSTPASSDDGRSSTWSTGWSLGMAAGVLLLTLCGWAAYLVATGGGKAETGFSSITSYSHEKNASAETSSYGRNAALRSVAPGSYTEPSRPSYLHTSAEFSSPPAQPAPEEIYPVRESLQQFLAEFESTLRQLKELELSVSKLQRTQEFGALRTIQVTPAYAAQQSAMLRLIESELPTFQQNVLDKNFEYYFDEKGRLLSIQQRVQEIRTKLAELSPPKEGCDQIRRAFQVWAASGPTHEWCSAVDKFAQWKTITVQ